MACTFTERGVVLSTFTERGVVMSRFTERGVVTNPRVFPNNTALPNVALYNELFLE
jgi:hypothetical protein